MHDRYHRNADDTCTRIAGLMTVRKVGPTGYMKLCLE